MTTATLSEKVQDAADMIREKVEDFDPEELLSVAEETARTVRRQIPVNAFREKALDRVKKRPFAAIGLAFIAGTLLGAVFARLAAASCARTGDSLVS